MIKTKEKIILAAIELYNARGLVNVLSQDIAERAGVSLSNFNYHFKTKKKIVHAVFKRMNDNLEKRIAENSILTHAGNGLEISKIYLKFQLEYCFYYCDTANILKTYPGLKKQTQGQIDTSLKIIKNINYLAIGKGYMKPEPTDCPGLYDKLAVQIWLCNHFWSVQRKIREKGKHSVKKGLESVYAILYPYLTTQGLEVYGNFLSNQAEA